MGPLIDCVFLLLIFFLVVAVTKKSVKELDIRLPDAPRAAAEAKPRDEDFVIRITPEGTAYLASDEMTPQTLRRAIRDAGALTPNRKVRLEADVRTPMSVLAPILDELEFSGFGAIAIRAAADTTP